MTPYELKAAAAELEVLNRKIINTLGIRFKATADAPSSFTQLKAYKTTDIIPVSNESCETAIYSLRGNIEFRAVHDYFHLLLGANFSREDEYRAISKHYWMLYDKGASPEALEVFSADTYSQVDYYYHCKKFVENQSLFVAYICNGGAIRLYDVFTMDIEIGWNTGIAKKLYLEFV